MLNNDSTPIKSLVVHHKDKIPSDIACFIDNPCADDNKCKRCRSSDLNWQLVPDPNGDENQPYSFRGISFSIREIMDHFLHFNNDVKYLYDKSLHSIMKHMEKIILRMKTK